MMDDDTQANTTADTDMMLDELKDKSESTRSTRSTQGQGQGQGHVWVSAKDVMLLLHKRSSTVLVHSLFMYCSFMAFSVFVFYCCFVVVVI